MGIGFASLCLARAAAIQDQNAKRGQGQNRNSPMRRFGVWKHGIEYFCSGSDIGHQAALSRNLGATGHLVQPPRGGALLVSCDDILLLLFIEAEGRN